MKYLFISILSMFFIATSHAQQTAGPAVRTKSGVVRGSIEEDVSTIEEDELARIMNTYWTNFAKTGNPNGKGLPTWPLYDTKKEEILDVDLDGKVKSKPDPRKDRLNVIEKAFKKRERLQSRGI